MNKSGSILTMDELITTIQYIVSKSNELKNTFPETTSAPVEFACIFCQNDEEYEKYTNLINPLGKVVEDTKSGYTYFLKEPISTSSGLLRLVKIRKPDSARKERGDADFNTNYKKLKEKYVDDPRFELIKRDNFEMLRLSEPNFDVMVCFSNIPKSTILGIKL